MLVLPMKPDAKIKRQIQLVKNIETKIKKTLIKKYQIGSWKTCLI